MGFYAYLTPTPDAPGMTDEPLGTAGQWIWNDLRTTRGAVNRLRDVRGGWKLFRYTDWYDRSTFRLVAVREA